jgi:hypothetical protein
MTEVEIAFALDTLDATLDWFDRKIESAIEGKERNPVLFTDHLVELRKEKADWLKFRDEFIEWQGESA